MFKDDMPLLAVKVFILISYRLDCPKIRIMGRSWAMLILNLPEVRQDNADEQIKFTE